MPEEDRYGASKEDLLAHIAVLMAGRAAEELTFGRMNAGAANDIERASQLARDMVCRYGMSKLLGPIHFGRKASPLFLGGDMNDGYHHSESMAKAIDEEVRSIVDSQYERAKSILEKQREKLNLLASELLKAEVLEERELDELLGPSAQRLCKEKKAVSSAREG